ncbi:MAG: hypothetical protein QM756_22170 [Polyangiaceae bacterium]
MNSLPPMQIELAPLVAAPDAPQAPSRLPSLQSRPETLHAHVVPATPKARGRGRWFVGGALVLAVAASAALYVKRNNDANVARLAAERAAAAKVATAPVPAAADRVGVATRAVHEVHFVLSPIDSHVFRGDEDLGPMPVSVQVEEGSPATLTVRRKGYMTRKVVVDGSDTRVVVGLMRAEPPQGGVSKVPAVIRRKL